MEDKRKQDLEDEMNRFEQEIAGNLPPPPKVHASQRLQPPRNALQNNPFMRQMSMRNMPFPGPPPPMPLPHMFGGQSMMDGMQAMPPSMPMTMDGMPMTMDGMPMTMDGMPMTMDGMPMTMDGMPMTMDGMPMTIRGIPPMPPGLPVPPPMMGMGGPSMGPPMMGMAPSIPPAPVPGPSTVSKSGKIAPPTVPLKNYDASQVAEVEEEPEETVSQDVGKETKQNQKKSKKKTVLRVAGGVVWEDDTLLDWERDDFRIFVGDLGNEVSDDALLRAFSRYPSLLKAKVIRDKKTKKTKGFGFVSFKDPQDYLKAMREMNGRYVGNRPIKLRKSSWKDRNIHIAKKKEKEKKKLGLR